MRHHYLCLFTLSIFIAACQSQVQPLPPKPDIAPDATQTVRSEAVSIEEAPLTPTQLPAVPPEPVGDLGSAGLNDSLFPNFGNGGYDVQHYDLQLNWDDQTGEIAAVAKIEVIATQNLSGFNLDLHGLTVDAVQVNSEPAAYSRSGDELTILLSDGAVLAEGSRFITTVSYHGVPNPVFDNSFAVGWLAYDTGVYVVSEPTGSQSWYPVNNHPSDKATYSMQITVPEPYVVVANGATSDPIENKDEGMITYVFEEDDLMASYLTTVNIAEFEIQSELGEQSGIPITNYIEKDVLDEYSDVFKNQDEILAMLIEKFGPYPFDEIGGVVPAKDIGYALETQTIPIYGQGILDHAGDYVIVHELAHQWFGNSLTPKTWDQIWLNEGFANYSEILLVEYLHGQDAAEAHVQSQYDAELESRRPPGNIVSGDPRTLFSSSVYQRGGLTLHALRVTVGDEIFFDILQTYAARFAYSNVSTEDFVAVAEEVSGEPLDDLFDAWLYQPELPELPKWYR